MAEHDHIARLAKLIDSNIRKDKHLLLTESEVVGLRRQGSYCPAVKLLPRATFAATNFLSMAYRQTGAMPILVIYAIHRLRQRVDAQSGAGA